MTKANKLSVDALKDQFEQKRQMDLNTQKMAARKELGKLHGIGTTHAMILPTSLI